MKLGLFYFVNDQYFIDFKSSELEINKSTKEDLKHDRPCFYAIKEEKSIIYWMIPISSKIDKYRILHDNKIKKYKKCDTIVFGHVLGYDAVFLIQNMFPVTENYIREEYINSKTNELVRIDFELEEELKKKANRVLSLERKGVKLLFGNALEIEKKLIKMNKNQKALENQAISELKTLQNEFKDEALKSGINDEEDVINVLKENYKK